MVMCRDSRMNWSLARSKISLGIAYFVVASLALTLTRYEGSVAFLWGATALLIADLLRQPRSRWLYSIVPCSIASGVATGLFGLGWTFAPAFIAINIAEALIAVWLFRRNSQQAGMLGSLGSLAHFAIAAGVVAPLAAATMAGTVLWSADRSFAAAFIDVATGHALGNITFTPLAMLFARGQVWRKLAATPPRTLMQTVALLALMVVVTVFVFTQDAMPLLFLPVLPIIVIAFRVGAAPTVIAVVLLALIGGAATHFGLGPIALFDAPLARQLLLFQFYLATTVLSALPVVADLENRARLLRRVRFSEERYRLIADHSTDVLLHLEVDGVVRYVSPSIEPISGYSVASLVGRDSLMLIALAHRDRVAAAHRAVIAGAGLTQTFDYLGLAANGSERWFENHSRAICDDQGRVESIISIARDISARKATELRLVEEAMTDPLTGLPNRRSFEAAIARCMPASAHDTGHCVAVFDIDRFKLVNDQHGHDAGDAVLCTFAEVLRRVVREGDMVARIGGEEFAAFLPSTAVGHALVICDRLRAEMANTATRIDGNDIVVTVSGGVALVGDDGAEMALKQADLALYTAKRGGRDQMAVAA